MSARSGYLLFLILILVTASATACTGKTLPVPVSGSVPTITLAPTETRIPTVTPIPDLPTLPLVAAPNIYDPLSATLGAKTPTLQPNGTAPAQKATLPVEQQVAAPQLPTGKLTGNLLGLIPSPAGLWAIRPDGSQLTLLTNDPIAQLTIAPNGWSAAYLTSVGPDNPAYNQPYGYTLKIITLYNDAIYTVTSIDPPNISANSSPETLDSAYQALNAYSHGAIVWSPDSRLLAFTSMHAAQPNQPASSDIFTYSPSSGRLNRLTQLHLPNGPSFPYGLSWSPDSTHLFYAAAHGFGSGSAGLWMAGAWVVGTDGSSVQVAPGDVTGGETLRSWITGGTMLISSWKGDCGDQNLRTFNLHTTDVVVAWPGCFNSASYDRARSEILVNVTPEVANPSANSAPGLYLVSLARQEAHAITKHGFDQILPGGGSYGPDKASWYGYNRGEGLFAIQRDGTLTQVFSGPPFNSTTGIPFRPLFRLTNGDWLWSGDGLYVGRTGYPPQQIIAGSLSSFTSSPARGGLFFYLAPSGDHLGLYGIRSRDWQPFLIDDHIPNPSRIGWTG